MDAVNSFPIMESEITCPHCGYKDKDSWERTGDDGEMKEIDCDSCDKPFTVETHVSVSYTSYIKEAKLQNKEG